MRRTHSRKAAAANIGERRAFLSKRTPAWILRDDAYAS